MWFPGMDKPVHKEIVQCMPCQVTVSTHKQELLKPTQLPQEPWDKLAIDLYGPLASGEYLLVVQCHNSRFPIAEVVSSTSVLAMIPAMDRIMSNFGIHTELIGDNGPLTTVKLLNSLLTGCALNIQRRLLTSWPNGMAENVLVRSW